MYLGWLVISCLMPYTYTPPVRILTLSYGIILLCCLPFYIHVYPNLYRRILKATYVYTIVTILCTILEIFSLYSSYLLSRTMIALFLNNLNNDASNPYYCYQVQDKCIAFLVEELDLECSDKTRFLVGFLLVDLYFSV